VLLLVLAVSKYYSNIKSISIIKLHFLNEII